MLPNAICVFSTNRRVDTHICMKWSCIQWQLVNSNREQFIRLEKEYICQPVRLKLILCVRESASVCVALLKVMGSTCLCHAHIISSLVLDKRVFSYVFLPPLS